jgi:DNA transposition AAA+ family ATPase
MKNYQGWKDLQTRQSKEILSELMEASEEARALLLISATGLGKSNTIKLFMNRKPKFTYCITVGASFKLINIVDALLDEMGIEYGHLRNHLVHKKLNLISGYLKSLPASNTVPTIIIDEAENLQPSVLKMIKELYDAIHSHASIVLIGTEQILDAILNRKHKNRQSVPQLWRRFKAGTRYISPLKKDRDFKQFFDLYIPGNIALQALLISLCNNYGELHDYLDPVLARASKQGKEPSEELCRLLHKIPNA